MTESISRLLDLQKLDVELRALREREIQIPATSTAIEKSVLDKEAALAQSRQALKKSKETNRLKELDLASLEEKSNRLKVQLLGARDNREYDAFQREIEAEQTKINAVEDAILTELDSVDNLRERCRQAEDEIGREKLTLVARRAQLDEELAQVVEEIREKAAQREEFAGAINKECLSNYSRLHRGFRGSTVVPVVGQSCGGCRMSLPPQVMAELLDDRKLLLCPGCGRIIYLGEALAASDV